MSVGSIFIEVLFLLYGFEFLIPENGNDLRKIIKVCTL